MYRLRVFALAGLGLLGLSFGSAQAGWRYCRPVACAPVVTALSGDLHSGAGRGVCPGGMPDPRLRRSGRSHVLSASGLLQAALCSLAALPVIANFQSIGPGIVARRFRGHCISWAWHLHHLMGNGQFRHVAGAASIC